MAKARFDIPSQLPASLTRPLYAGVGVTDRVVAVVREAVAETQKRALAVQQDVTRTVAELDRRPQALGQQAADAVTARVEALGQDARDLPVRLQKLVDGQVATAGDAYDGLVKRGEDLLGRIRRQPATAETVRAAETTVAKARTTRTQASKTAKTATTSAKRTTKRTAKRTTKKAATSPARSSAKATGTAARKTARSATRAAAGAAAKVGD